MVYAKEPKYGYYVTTIKEQCRVCYTCVRECPAKAIRIVDGQAKVIGERCIGCGNCVRVCSQKAKQVVCTIDEVENILKSGSDIAACIAPSFPAEFHDLDYRKLVGMLRELGFKYVNEVAFGADLVAGEYKKLLGKSNNKKYIATTCPAIIGFVERYNPDFVDSLAPIVSPMVAESRVLKKLYGKDLKVVFIGPCIAKKCESAADNIKDEIDAVLTFNELQQMFIKHNIDRNSIKESEFDPPRAGVGALFPISRGLLQAADIKEDLLSGEVVAADGRSDFVEAIKEFISGDLDVKLLEVLCCNGCIMGAGMTTEAPLFQRRYRVSQFVQSQLKSRDSDEWNSYYKKMAGLDLSRKFTPNDQRIPVPSDKEIAAIMEKMGKHSPEDELNCGACGYDTCKEHAIAIYKGLAENEMCLPYTIDKLRDAIQDLAVSNEQLASTQHALMQSEKLASMGQLAAGVAHEVNNPLGIILMYSHILLDEIEQNSPLHGDLKMISDQADRCRKIVSGLLDFARENKVVLESVSIAGLVEKVLDTISEDPKISVSTEHKEPDLIVNLDKDQITQVLINIINNAYAAMSDGGLLKVETGREDNKVFINITDTGVGIPKEYLGRIFDPFFTTKPIGHGTGLGLAVTYGIVKMHKGDIKVESNADCKLGQTGTTFKITIPINS